MLPAMVLAAGLGTRLRPLTDARAKALVPIGDRPALAHVLDRLAAAGSPRVVVNAHHRAGDVRDFVRTRGPTVAISEERELLGTAGGLARAAALLGAEGDVIIWNADVFLEVDLGALVDAHASHSADATLLVRPRERGQGNLGLDGDGRIVRLRAERAGDEAIGGEFASVHVIGGALRAGLPARGCLVGDVYIPAMRRGANLRGFVRDVSFFDIGEPGRYLDANLAWLAQSGGRSWVGAGARVSTGTTLERSVVGAGASVEGEGMLDRCVVWPGAVATAPLSRAIVADGCILRL